MEKKIYEKPCSVAIDMVPLDCLLGLSLQKGISDYEDPPYEADAPMFQGFADDDYDSEEGDVTTWGVNWDD